MAELQFPKEFWFNVILFIVACVALGIAIWAFATPCKKSESFLGAPRKCTAQDIQRAKLNDGENNYLDMATNIVSELNSAAAPEWKCKMTKDDPLLAACAASLLNEYQIYCCIEQADCPSKMYPQPNTDGEAPRDTIKFYANYTPNFIFYVWRNIN